MIYVSVRHTVADYAKWRPIFDADLSHRRAGGATGVQQVYRDLANPNEITLVMEWDSAESAEKFLHSPALAETMKGAGVIGAPEGHMLSRA
jgi:quinol monooxygenase YgiN